tara:strand:+ start:36 stop:299 length:264 start_codon:yes stop_codon:yes gene_type:complete
METIAQKYIDHTLNKLKDYALEDKHLAQALDNLLDIIELPKDRNNYTHDKNYNDNDDRFATNMFVEQIKKLELINFITKNDYSKPLT